MPKYDNQAGFTLIELLLGMTITIILLAGILGILSTSVRSWNYGDAQYDVQQIVRIATNRVTSDLRYGTNYAVLVGYSDANDNEAIRFTSRKDGIVYTYYVDKEDRHLYRSPGYSGSTPELVLGQAVKNIQDINIEAPTNEDIFSLEGASSVHISLLVKDTKRHQSYIIRTTVSDIGVFLK